MPADDDDRDPPGPGQLQRHRGRLGAAPGYPGVIHNQDVGPGHRSVDAQPAGVDAASMGRSPWGHREADERKVDTRSDEAEQWMAARPALAARHDGGELWSRRHPGRSPHRLSVIPQVDVQHLPQSPGGFCRTRAVRLVPPQVAGEPTAPDRVADRRHRVREQLPGLSKRQVALIAPGEPDRRRPPAGPADHPPDARNRHRQTRPPRPRTQHDGPLCTPGCRQRSIILTFAPSSQDDGMGEGCPSNRCAPRRRQPSRRSRTRARLPPRGRT